MDFTEVGLSSLRVSSDLMKEGKRKINNMKKTEGKIVKRCYFFSDHDNLKIKWSANHLTWGAGLTFIWMKIWSEPVNGNDFVHNSISLSLSLSLFLNLLTSKDALEREFQST